jgi:cytochrome c-type biogenesis protein CcmH/NrfG
MKMIKTAVKATLGFVLVGSAVFAQSITDAKKAIDAEQYQKSKTILKGLISSQPANAESYFYLGNVYLKTDYADSAKMTYTKGITANAQFPLNYIGLGAVDFSSGKGNPKANFDKALSLTPKKDATTLLFIGRAYTVGAKPDYASAVTALEKAKTIDPKKAEVYLALADAYRGQLKNSEAYSNYRTAFDLDKKLLRAKVELGVLNKLSKAYPESVAEFNSVIALDPNYGPAYRELAETYYYWGNAELKFYNERIKQALAFYEKYMDLTDHSLESRERHATFLIVAKEYKALEKEANEMASMNKTNPRILRYLGYAAYENANYPASIQALKDWISKADTTRLIALDYLYLGRAQMKTPGLELEGITNLKKAVAKDSTNAEVMSDIGKALFSAKKYAEAAQTFEIAIKNPLSKTVAYDNFYLGMSNYFDYASQANAKKTPSKELLTKADSAFSYVIKVAPTNPDAYLYRARVKRLGDDPENMKGLMVPDYEKYLEIVLAKADATSESRIKNAVIEAYNNLGAYYIKTEPSKAKEYFNKVTQLDPANPYAMSALKQMGGSKK